MTGKRRNSDRKQEETETGDRGEREREVTEKNKQEAEETKIGNKGDTGGKQKRQSQESVPHVVPVQVL